MVLNSLCHWQVYQRRTHRRTHGIPTPYLDTKIYPIGFWCALCRVRTLPYPYRVLIRQHLWSTRAP